MLGNLGPPRRFRTAPTYSINRQGFAQATREEPGHGWQDPAKWDAGHTRGAQRRSGWKARTNHCQKPREFGEVVSRFNCLRRGQADNFRFGDARFRQVGELNMFMRCIALAAAGEVLSNASFAQSPPVPAQRAEHRFANSRFFALVEMLRVPLRKHEVPLAARNELLGILASVQRGVVKL
ncbi:MAG TPA: hypothetical protein VM146_04605 [Steroidobacteraceae bacterium]|nr:hypothetical protein [Steroidobacteraceae bacterium]